MTYSRSVPASTLSGPSLKIVRSDTEVTSVNSVTLKGAVWSLSSVTRLVRTVPTGRWPSTWVYTSITPDSPLTSLGK